MRRILQLGDPGLRLTSRTVEDFAAPKVRQIIDDLTTTLAGTAGVGLAAPQIGEAYQIIIVASKPTDRYPHAPLMPPVLMINPKMNVAASQQQKDWEGCLSIPGIRALVPRYVRIDVQYLDEQGQPQRLTLKDFPARVFQHEYDHLQGLVYLDRVETNRDIVAESVFLQAIQGRHT